MHWCISSILAKGAALIIRSASNTCAWGFLLVLGGRNQWNCPVPLFVRNMILKASSISCWSWNQDVYLIGYHADSKEKSKQSSDRLPQWKGKIEFFEGNEYLGFSLLASSIMHAIEDVKNLPLFCKISHGLFLKNKFWSTELRYWGTRDI